MTDILSADFWGSIFNFNDYGQLLALVGNSIVAGAVLGIVGGLIGVFVAGIPEFPLHGEGAV